MQTKRFEAPTKLARGIIEIDGNELRIQHSINPIWIRFKLTDELRKFLKDI